MIKNLTFTIACLGFSLATHMAHADDISMGEPAYGGSGGPNGSASVTLSPDGKQLSVLFDDYVVEAGGGLGRVARKSCNLAIPIHVPQGFSVSIFKVDYRGYAFVPRGGRGQLSAEYFFAGRRGPKVVKNFRGGHDDDYLMTNNLAASALVWSACGADVNLRVNSAMRVITNRYGDDALATVDSIDVDSGMIYHIQWRRCSGSSGGWF